MIFKISWSGFDLLDPSKRHQVGDRFCLRLATLSTALYEADGLNQIEILNREGKRDQQDNARKSEWAVMSSTKAFGTQ